MDVVKLRRKRLHIFILIKEIAIMRTKQNYLLFIKYQFMDDVTLRRRDLYILFKEKCKYGYMYMYI